MADLHLVVGVVLIGVGLVDALLGLLLIGPRIPDPAKRQHVIGAMIASGLVLVGLGVVFLTGVIR